MAHAQELEPSQIEQAAAGDEVAQECLYRCYQQRVYTLAYRLMGNRADAQDVTQDSFIRCFESLHQYRGEAPLWAWLKQLTVRTALMRLRSLKRWRWISLEHMETPLETTAGGAGPADQVQTGQDLQRALNQLSPTARAVVYLYHGEGYNHAEIAALWGKSVSFSKSQLARAQQRLRQILEAQAQTVQSLATAALMPSAPRSGEGPLQRRSEAQRRPAGWNASDFETATASAGTVANLRLGDEDLS